MRRLVRANGSELGRRHVSSVDRVIRPSPIRVRDFVEPLLLDAAGQNELLGKLSDADLSLACDRNCPVEPLLALLDILRSLGVSVYLGAPRKPLSLAEWDPKTRSVRVSPAMARGGTCEFQKALTHEAIHVAQSCKAGSLSAPPVLLGLPLRNRGKASAYTSHAVYRNLSSVELRVEQEAYDNQDDALHAIELLTIYGESI